MTIRRPLWASQRGQGAAPGIDPDAPAISFVQDADGNGVLTEDEVTETITVRASIPASAAEGDIIRITNGAIIRDTEITDVVMGVGYVDESFTFPETDTFVAAAWVRFSGHQAARTVGVMRTPSIPSGEYDEESGEIVLDFEDDSTGEPDSREVYRDTAAMDASNLPPPHANLPASQTQFREAVAEDGTTYYYRTANVKGNARRVSDEVSLPAEPGGNTNPGDDFATAAIGDEIGGGIYAGINTESDDTQYYIIFAMQSGELAASAESRWKVELTSTPGTTSHTDGWANTQAMEAAGLTDHPAALYCRNYTGGDNNDWHLPARTELALEANIRGHAEMSTDTAAHRWASTESSASYAWRRRFSDGAELNNGVKDFTSRRVRPVRRVAV